MSVRARPIAARAPGKVFVTGEYAVLDGAPALVAAVDLHAHVTVRLGEVGGPLVIESAIDGCTTLARHGPATVEGDAAAVLAAYRAVAARLGWTEPPGAFVDVDARGFLVGGRKLGLGRSAATLVATTAALLAASGVEGRDAVLAVALAANARLQEGQGSGADVVAAVHGGLVEVRRTSERLCVARRGLPRGAHLEVGWTGTSAATTPLLRSFAARAPRAAETLAALKAVAEDAATAVGDGDTEAFTGAIRRSAVLLERLGVELDLPIVTPALARLIQAAERVHACAKPAGAGGGDCGIAIARSADYARAVRRAWQDEGICPLGVAIAAQGVALG